MGRREGAEKPVRKLLQRTGQEMPVARLSTEAVRVARSGPILGAVSSREEAGRAGCSSQEEFQRNETSSVAGGGHG